MGEVRESFAIDCALRLASSAYQNEHKFGEIRRQLVQTVLLVENVQHIQHKLA